MPEQTCKPSPHSVCPKYKQLDIFALTSCIELGCIQGSDMVLSSTLIHSHLCLKIEHYNFVYLQAAYPAPSIHTLLLCINNLLLILEWS